MSFDAADQVWADLGYASRGAFGKDVWGRGEEGAEHFRRTMTRERLQEIGLTKDGAAKWRDAYSAEFVSNPKNMVAGARESLMSHYVELLSE